MTTIFGINPLSILVPGLELIIIILGTWIVARLFDSLLKSTLKRSPPAVIVQAKPLVKLAVWIGGLAIAMEYFGLPVDLLLLVIGLLGIGMLVATRDVLPSVTARYFSDVYVRFRLGDTIKVGNHEGKVIEMNPLSTMLITNKSEIVSVPNAMFVHEITINSSPMAWKEIVVPIIIANSVDLAEFEKQVLVSCNKLRVHLDDKSPPTLSIKNRGPTSTELLLNLKVKTPETKDSVISEVNYRVSEIVQRIGRKGKT